MRLFPARWAACLAVLAIGVAAPQVAPATAAPAPAHAGHHRSAGSHPTGHPRELTMKLRDLFVARDKLGFFSQLRATALLARPTDGSDDPGGEGYRHPAKRSCSAHVCVHYETRGPDAPSSTQWRQRTLHTIEAVWHHEVGQLGFRPPPSDRHRGGDGRFDVYLKDLGSRGLFGYCSPERRVKGERHSASGYCVLDNDFARRQFGARRIVSLRVTAAHEFFHAIQFGYDFRADPWLMESTAAWMEESFADDANDNRRYLPYGDVHHPGIPLDRYSNTGYAQYGDWAFWQWTTMKYGDELIRAVWRRVDHTKGGPGMTSLGALRYVLARRTHDEDGGIRRVLTSYALANIDPARSYPEGESWPRATVLRGLRLRPGGDRRETHVTVNHLAAKDLRLAIAGHSRGRLHVWVRAPRRRSAVALTVVRADGSVRRRVLSLDKGAAATTVDLTHHRVSSVVVTLVNASARYQCGQGTMWTCGGKPRDDDKGFRVTAQLGRA